MEIVNFEGRGLVESIGELMGNVDRDLMACERVPESPKVDRL
jgi:hypothetical protein